MTRYRSPEEIRRYDLMKLGVLLLLFALLFLTWFATRDNGPLDLSGETETTVAEATAAGDGLTREPGTMPAPTLAPPAITAPAGPLPPGTVTLSGVAGPGAQVRVLADGQPLGLASAGVDGAWSLTTDLPAGAHTLVAQTLDNVGAVVAESAPLPVTVGDRPAAGAQVQIDFDQLTDSWSLAGDAAPGATVTIQSGDATLGETTADDTGTWSLTIPAANVTGELAVQTTDPAGTTTTESLTLGVRPPGVIVPGQSTASEGPTVFVVPVGVSTWSGQGAPGTQVEVSVDGQLAGMALVDESGNWSLSFDLPAGEHVVQLNSLDAAGGLLYANGPIPVSAGEAVVEGPGTPIAITPDAGTTPDAATTPDATTTPGVTSPPADNIIAALQSQPEFETLTAALQMAGLSDQLAGPGTFTLFAPTDDAFAALPQAVVDALWADPPVLSQLLQYHIVRGHHTVADLRVVQPATVNGRLLTIVPQGDSISVNGAAVLAADTEAGNGLIHVIDRILLPPLAAGVRPPVIDESGVPTFVGPRLTVVGTGEPGRTIYVEIDGEAFGEPAVVDANGDWQLSGDVGPGEHQIVAFMVNEATLEAFSRPVALPAP